ncbi:hypothetical protein SCWH03_34850 [Streptomyces pacificus]|uniref:Uncharacterized protein n=1 Tax=Streptomyces pacificus TaxID=2705029 RepID=A0A6A0AWE6_9ACTN|nr:hypothetical protein SCWH03_34850 [Streptomyces pacificus]
MVRTALRYVRWGPIALCVRRAHTRPARRNALTRPLAPEARAWRAPGAGTPDAPACLRAPPCTGTP